MEIINRQDSKVSEKQLKFWMLILSSSEFPPKMISVLNEARNVKHALGSFLGLTVSEFWKKELIYILQSLGLLINTCHNLDKEVMLTILQEYSEILK